MTDYLTIVPAYGRDYKTAADALKAWQDDKDFVLRTSHPKYSRWDGSYINRPQQPKGAEMHIRYNQLQDILVIREDGTPVMPDEEDELPEPLKECNTGHSHLPHDNCPGIGLIQGMHDRSGDPDYSEREVDDGSYDDETYDNHLYDSNSDYGPLS